MKVNWTDTAQRHLTAIHAYIAEDAPVYARDVVDRITSRSKQIATFPRSGRRVPEYDDENVREVFEGAYRVIYHIQADRVDVVAVVHGAQQLSERQ